jgi:hypothetical protein
VNRDYLRLLYDISVGKSMEIQHPIIEVLVYPFNQSRASCTVRHTRTIHVAETRRIALLPQTKHIIWHFIKASCLKSNSFKIIALGKLLHVKMLALSTLLFIEFDVICGLLTCCSMSRW